jgi:hypothetical protein
MTRTDVMASSRPRTALAASSRTGSRAIRRLTLLPIILLLSMALLAPGSALAASESNTSSGYNQEPNKPSTGTSPSEETEKPATTPSTEATPTTTTTPEAATTKTLPFTGFDLRWSFGLGLLLMGAGFSIVVVQRRQRREDGR